MRERSGERYTASHRAGEKRTETKKKKLINTKNKKIKKKMAF